VPPDPALSSSRTAAEPPGLEEPDTVVGGPAWRGRAAALLALVTAVEVGLAAVLAVQRGASFSGLLAEHEVDAGLAALSLSAVAAVVLRRYPRHTLGWLFMLTGQLLAVSVFGAQYGTDRSDWSAGPAQWAGVFLWIPAQGIAAGLFTPLFPDGRPYSRRWRPLVWLAALAVLTSSISALLLDDLFRLSGIGRSNPLSIGARAQPILGVMVIGGLLVALACGVIGAVLLAVQMAATSGAERARIGWFFAAFMLAALTSVLPLPRLVQLAPALFVPVALGIAMLRHGLYQADRLLTRTVVYTVLTVLVAAVLGSAAGLASLGVGGSGTGAVIAAVVIALGFLPMRTWLQRGVDRLLYGGPHDPYTLLRDLGHQLSAAIRPDEVLPTATSALFRALRLGSVSVYLGDDPVPVAAEGTPDGQAVEFPMQHAGEILGRIAVTPRPGQHHLGAQDEMLVRDFADSLGVAAQAARLTHDLRRSRDRLAIAHDEERHRIHRDLHDRLGPSLAGLALGIGAARRAAPATAGLAPLLARLDDEMHTCLDDVRRLITRLGPSSLDEMGLVDALRQQAARISDRSDEELEVTVCVPTMIPVMPAEVELAAFHIGMEALTNVTRHAHASHCQVTLDAADGVLQLQVRDDGVGLPARAAASRALAGVGMRSMMERAVELGGRCVVEGVPTGGTLVKACLPLGALT
jgi:two-component system NarL family sensor kinase